MMMMMMKIVEANIFDNKYPVPLLPVLASLLGAVVLSEFYIIPPLWPQLIK